MSDQAAQDWYAYKGKAPATTASAWQRHRTHRREKRLAARQVLEDFAAAANQPRRDRNDAARRLGWYDWRTLRDAAYVVRRRRSAKVVTVVIVGAYIVGLAGAEMQGRARPVDRFVYAAAGAAIDANTRDIPPRGKDLARN